MNTDPWAPYAAAVDAWRARASPQTAGDALARYRDLCRALGVPPAAIEVLTEQHAITRTLSVAA